MKIKIVVMYHIPMKYVLFFFFFKTNKNQQYIVFVLSLQTLFGTSGSDSSFRMFTSQNGKNLLFKDSTKCLQEVPSGQSYSRFLGEEYMIAMSSLRHCSDSTSGLSDWHFTVKCSIHAHFCSAFLRSFPPCLLTSHQIWRNLALSIPARKPRGGVGRSCVSFGSNYFKLLSHSSYTLHPNCIVFCSVIFCRLVFRSITQRYHSFQNHNHVTIHDYMQLF